MKADTVVGLRYFEAAGLVRQAIAVIKKRSGRRERTIREFLLPPGRSIRFGAPWRALCGVLTGILEFHGRTEPMLEPPDAGN